MKDSGIEWIGDIPENWNIFKVKHCFMRKNSKAKQEDPVVLSLARSGVKVRDISTNEGQLAESYCDYNPVQVGDLLLNPMDLYSGANCSYSNVEGVISPAYINLKNKEGVSNSKFYDYYFKVQYWMMVLFSFGKGVSFDNRWTLGQETLMNFPIIHPSLSEQEKIANFLDEKCSYIDLVLKKTRASIEEYKQLKQSVITQAVTKGIRPNRPMKNSGIEWIGEIPTDWKVYRIKTLFNLRDERNTLPLEEVNLISLYTDIGVIQHSDIEAKTGNKASNADGYKKVYENDIVVNIILCWMGAIGRSAYNGVTSPAYDVYTPNADVNSNYYHHYFRTTGFNGDCYKRGRGIMAMRWRTYSDQFRDIRVVVPSTEEQQEIVNYLDTKCAEIDKLIEKKEQLIEEFETYKKSLIYEYVTGKKEVV